jgi:hypothetical protein
MESICAKCNAAKDCTQFKIIVTRLVDYDHNIHTYYTEEFVNKSWRWQYETTIASSLCRHCKAEVYRKFFLDRFRPLAIHVLCTLLVCIGLAYYSFRGSFVNDGFHLLFDLALVCSLGWLAISLLMLLFSGFVTEERACTFALEGILWQELKNKYQTGIWLYENRPSRTGEIQLFTEEDWDRLCYENERDNMRSRRKREKKGPLVTNKEMFQDGWISICYDTKPFREFLQNLLHRSTTNQTD